MIEDTCGIHFPQEWKSRLKNFAATVLFEFNGLIQKTTLDSCIFQKIMGHLRTNPRFTIKDQFTVLGNFLDPLNQFRGWDVAGHCKSSFRDFIRIAHIEDQGRRIFSCNDGFKISLAYCSGFGFRDVTNAVAVDSPAYQIFSCLLLIKCLRKNSNGLVALGHRETGCFFSVSPLKNNRYFFLVWKFLLA